MLQIYEVLHIVSIIFSIVFSYVLKCGFYLYVVLRYRLILSLNILVSH